VAARQRPRKAQRRPYQEIALGKTKSGFAPNKVGAKQFALKLQTNIQTQWTGADHYENDVTLITRHFRHSGSTESNAHNAAARQWKFGERTV